MKLNNLFYLFLNQITFICLNEEVMEFSCTKEHCPIISEIGNDFSVHISVFYRSNNVLMEIADNDKKMLEDLSLFVTFEDATLEIFYDWLHSIAKNHRTW